MGEHIKYIFVFPFVQIAKEKNYNMFPQCSQIGGKNRESNGSQKRERYQYDHIHCIRNSFFCNL